MKQSDRLAVLLAAQELCDRIYQLSTVEIQKLALKDVSEPIAIASAIRPRLDELHRELFLEPYLRGDAPVQVFETSKFVSQSGKTARVWVLVPGDDPEDAYARIVAQQFETEADAEEYARSHGMQLLQTETVTR
jgi:hypothetical protein